MGLLVSYVVLNFEKSHTASGTSRQQNASQRYHAYAAGWASHDSYGSGSLSHRGGAALPVLPPADGGGGRAVWPSGRG
jgi:hypothetical protein